MLVLEATDEFQGLRPGDYHHAANGELVHLPVSNCDCADCGCSRGFCGFDSHRATTTAKVVDRPDYNIERLAKELATSLCQGGWIEEANPSDELVVGLAIEIVELASQWSSDPDTGSVLELEGEVLGRRYDAETQATVDRFRRRSERRAS